MNALLTLACLLIVAFQCLCGADDCCAAPARVRLTFTSFDAVKALLFCGAVATATGWIFYRRSEHGLFLLRIFVAALLARMLLGTLIFVFNGREFFGADAIHYDYLGIAQTGSLARRSLLHWHHERYTSGELAAPGAWSTGSGHLCFARQEPAGDTAGDLDHGRGHRSRNLFVRFTRLQKRQSGEVFRLCCRFFPLAVLWSSQGLKDGPIVFFWRSQFWPL